MGRIYLRELRDYAKAGIGIKVRCEHCGHTAVKDAFQLTLALGRLRKKSSIFELRRALRCSACREKWVALTPHPQDR